METASRAEIKIKTKGGSLHMTISFGVIGTNFITDRFIAAGSLLSQFKVTAVCSRQLETAQQFADKHQITYSFTDIDEMLDSGHIQALYIAAPTSLHAHYAKIALAKGIHVLCEKPVTSNSAELRELIALAKQHNVLFMEAMKSSFMPAYRQAAQYIGEIGQVRRFFASFCQYSSRYDAYKAGNVMNAFKPDYSNGALMDIGVYCIYPAVMLFGKPNAVKASAYMLESGVDGEGSIILQYDHMDAVLMYSKITNSSLPLEIQGEDGNLILNRVSDPDEIHFVPRGGESKNISLPTVEHDMYYEIAEFIHLLEAGKTESSINSFENSLITMEIMDEARKQIGLVFPADRQ